MSEVAPTIEAGVTSVSMRGLNRQTSRDSLVQLLSAAAQHLGFRERHGPEGWVLWLRDPSTKMDLRSRVSVFKKRSRLEMASILVLGFPF